MTHANAGGSYCLASRAAPTNIVNIEVHSILRCAGEEWHAWPGWRIEQGMTDSGVPRRYTHLVASRGEIQRMFWGWPEFELRAA